MSYGHHLYPYGGIGVFKNILGVEFSISHTINTGAAWGAFSQWQLPLVALRIALICGMLIHLAYWNKQPEHRAPITLVVSGAACNVLDTFIYGHVVDMLHFILWGYDYPVFNVADAAIFIGVAWLLLLSLRGETSARSGA
jgi:signal peptidase II